jgi:hypothetical protein
VKVRAGDAAGGAAFAERRACRDRIAERRVDGVEVRVQGQQPLPVIQNERAPEERCSRSCW